MVTSSFIMLWYEWHTDVFTNGLFTYEHTELLGEMWQDEEMKRQLSSVWCAKAWTSCLLHHRINSRRPAVLTNTHTHTNANRMYSPSLLYESFPCETFLRYEPHNAQETHCSPLDFFFLFSPARRELAAWSSYFPVVWCKPLGSTPVTAI